MFWWLIETFNGFITLITIFFLILFLVANIKFFIPFFIVAIIGGIVGFVLYKKKKLKI